MTELPLNQIICGNSLDVLRTFPNDSVDCTVTSPPYWGLRDYGVETIFDGDPNCQHEWLSQEWNLNASVGGKGKQFTNRGTLGVDGNKTFKSNFCVKCNAWKGQLGQESDPTIFVKHLIEIFHEVKRVLKSTGTFWLNMGDTYFGGSSGQNFDSDAGSTAGGARSGNKETGGAGFGHIKRIDKARTPWLQPKQLLLIPERVAIAMQEDGWILRNNIVWFKPNHMPDSCRDRLTRSWEHVFLFVKKDKYYFDLDAIREPQKFPKDVIRRMRQDKQDGIHPFAKDSKTERWRRDLPTKHDVGTNRYALASYKDLLHEKSLNPNGKNPGDMWEICTYPFKGAHFAVFPPKLVERCLKAGCPKNGVVLDPFCGSGTTCFVAKRMKLNYIGIDVKPEYVEMAKKRLSTIGGLDDFTVNQNV